MTCVENVNKFIVPSDVIITLTKIYRLVGKNDKYKEISSWYNDKIIYQCLEKDIYYLSRLIELDISDNRARLLITKNSDARLKDEKVLLNIKEVLNAFSLNPKRQDISSSDLNNIINYVYSNSNQSIKYDNIKEERRNYYKKFTLGSKRDLIDKIFNFAKNNSNNIEPIIFTINYLIDLYGIQPFTQGNDTLCYLLL